MKKETKELIEGLKVCLKEVAMDNDGLHWLNCEGNECFRQALMWEDKIVKGEYAHGLCTDERTNYNRLVALLDNLESLENQLKHGGFIPDGNGKPCKDGDKVKITRFDGTVEHGKLEFDDYRDCYKFMLVVSDNEALYFDEVKSWEKEEE